MSNALQSVGQRPPRQSYFLQNNEGVGVAVHASSVPEAALIDRNDDGLLDREEQLDYLEHCHQGCHHHEHEKADMEALRGELEMHLLKLPNPVAKGYHSYEQVNEELDSLVAQYPDRCEKVSLGQSAEGREIWALRISKDVHSPEASERTGFVITGCHHAREWMSVEIPLHVGHELLDNYDTDPAARNRVDNTETWIVPVVNPDGYEYSRNSDNWWRKNRQPLEGGQVGVDLNRNYWDGNPDHFYLYRPPGDTPDSTADDFGSTSDNPRSDTYRGPAGGSEKELKALLDLELGHKNIRAVLDYHSYGEMLLYPWGSTSEPAPNAALYEEIGSRINEAMGNRYELQQSSGLYPCSGESDDCHNVNGLISFTMEVGRSFQPNPKTIPATCELVGKGNLAYMDEIIRRVQDGSLPPRPDAA